MRYVVMYTRPNKDVSWFTMEPDAKFSEYGIKLKKIAKTKRVVSVDGLSMWDFVEVPDRIQWIELRNEYAAVRKGEFERKASLGITAEIIQLEGDVGSEFFEFTKGTEGEPNLNGIWFVEGEDINVSKLFW